MTTFYYETTGLKIAVVGTQNLDGTITFKITVIEGTANINALFWNDGDTVVDGGTIDNPLNLKTSSLNMNGSGEVWDGGQYLSAAGLTKTPPPTYLTANQSYTFTTVSDVTLADIDNIGIRATSTSTPEGSIKGVAPIAAVELTKTLACVTGGTADAAGDVLTYNIAVDNTGEVALTGVTVTDKVEGYATTGAVKVDVDNDGFNDGDLDKDNKLDANETWHYTATYTLLQDDLDGKGGGDGDLDNVATVTTDQTVSDTDDESVPLVYDPRLEVTKVADVSSADEAGDVINYTITVENTGNITLNNVTVNDPLLGGLLTTFTGDLDNDGKLDVNETWTYSGSYEVTQDDLDGRGGGDGDLDNTVTADSTESDPDTADESVELVYNPKLEVTKVADVSEVDQAGDVINYTITVENTGNITLNNVTVNDPLLGGLLTSFTGDGDNDGKLDVDETWTYTAQYTVTADDIATNGGGDGDIDNTVTADSTESDPDTADETVNIVDLPPDPEEDDFPDLSKDISHVTFYFGDNSTDGVYTVKIDTPEEASDNLDDWYADALAAIITQDAYVTGTTVVLGVAIKGGKDLFDPDKDNTTDPYDQLYVWNSPNEDSEAYFAVTGTQNPDGWPNDPLPAGLTNPIQDSDVNNTILFDNAWLV